VRSADVLEWERDEATYGTLHAAAGLPTSIRGGNLRHGAAVIGHVGYNQRDDAKGKKP
jgi:hypothetical protein